MPSDGTVLEHLLTGRDALVQEVKRLTTAIEELDSVIARIGGERPAAEAPLPAASVEQQPENQSNSRAEVEPVKAPVPAKRAPAKQTGSRTRSAPTTRSPRRAAPVKATPNPIAAAPGQKSIRVHVLEMLGAEDRDFGLAEIIDKIHAEGIAAHDDAVRSITIKLMKDGRVERVGRGQYRLARRGGAAASTSTQPSAAQPEAGYVPPLDLGQSWQRPIN